MADHWKKQLQQIIELSRDRIRRLEAGGLPGADATLSCLDDANLQIEAEEKIIARLQKTIDALV